MTASTEAAVVVLAAGAGTRMRSDTPKVLHTLAGRGMLAHVLHTVSEIDARHLVAVLGHDRERIAPEVARLSEELGRAIDVAVQDQQLGTGHAVNCGLTALPHDFAGMVVVTSGDVPLLDTATLTGLITSHGSGDAAATVLTTTLPDPTGYGRILRTQDHEIIGIVEQADATESQRTICEVNTGVYAFDIADLRSALTRLRSDNAQHELYLTDVVEILRQDHRTVRALHVDDSALVTGVNDRVQLSDLGKVLNRRIVAAHQRAGVTIIDPAARGSTSTSRSARTPLCTREPNCSVQRASARTASSDRYDADARHGR